MSVVLLVTDIEPLNKVEMGLSVTYCQRATNHSSG